MKYSLLVFALLFSHVAFSQSTSGSSGSSSGVGKPTSGGGVSSTGTGVSTTGTGVTTTGNAATTLKNGVNSSNNIEVPNLNNTNNNSSRRYYRNSNAIDPLVNGPINNAPTAVPNTNSNSNSNRVPNQPSGTGVVSNGITTTNLGSGDETSNSTRLTPNPGGDIAGSVSNSPNIERKASGTKQAKRCTNAVVRSGKCVPSLKR